MAVRINVNQLKRELYRNNTTVSKNIRLLRLITKKTQNELADTLNLSRSAYVALEIGRKLPDLEMLITLSELYDVNIDYLISFDIADQMLSMIRADHEETEALRFLNRYFMLSRSGKDQIKAEIDKIKEHEEGFNNYPWDYGEYEDMFRNLTLEGKRLRYKRKG